MSFRLFIYYCALCGGWAAFVGWSLGRILSPAKDTAVDREVLGQMGIWGMMLGLMIALGLGLVDAAWNLGLRRWGQVFLRVGVGALVGAVGGLGGGMLGQALVDATGNSTLKNIYVVLGWTLTGLLVGLSIAAFEILIGLVKQQGLSGVWKKLIKCLIGGTVGGILGGVILIFLRLAWIHVFSGKAPTWLWSPSATGFVALGMCIGLLVGLAQVILKEAWIKVEAGFRPGREMILSKEQTTVGRAESCDIGLFGDNGIEKLHASIIQAGNRYYLEDSNTPGGTYINDQRINGRTPLRAGDLIRVGKSALRFNERQKKQS